MKARHVPVACNQIADSPSLPFPASRARVTGTGGESSAWSRLDALLGAMRSALGILQQEQPVLSAAGKVPIGAGLSVTEPGELFSPVLSKRDGQGRPQGTLQNLRAQGCEEHFDTHQGSASAFWELQSQGVGVKPGGFSCALLSIAQLALLAAAAEPPGTVTSRKSRFNIANMCTHRC